MARVHLSLGTLRLIAILAPIAFAVALGLTTELALQPALPGIWPEVTATLAVVVAAVAFSFFIFSLLRIAYGRIDQQKRELERNAAELEKLNAAERAHAEEWKALFELGEEVTASPEVDRLIRSIVERARKLLNTEVAALMLLAEDGRELRMAAHSGFRTAGMRSLGLSREHGLQGLVLETGGPVIVGDYRTDERLVNRPAKLVEDEGLVSLISVPFSGKGKVLGTLTVGNRRRVQFTHHEAELLQSFAHWTAVVVETSKLYERLRSLALLEERERIGMDLHDGAIQSIYAVVLRLDDAVDRLGERPEEARASLEKAMDDLNRVIRDIRNYIFDLRPELVGGDLTSALSDLVEEVRVNNLMDAQFAAEGDFDGALSEDQAVSLFRIAQEAVSNAGRHARASSLRVTLVARSEALQMEIVDDGVGFDPSQERPEDKRGLHNMEERARSLGARLTVESAASSGTRVAVELPVGQGKAETRAGT